MAFKNIMTTWGEIVLFRLIGSNGSNDVMLWPRYGIVMPSRVTSNGSPWIVAKIVMDMVSNWDYRIEAVEMNPDTSNFEALHNQLKVRLTEEVS